MPPLTGRMEVKGQGGMRLRATRQASHALHIDPGVLRPLTSIKAMN